MRNEPHLIDADRESAILHIHSVISLEYKMGINGMYRMFWSCSRLERIKKKWGITPPSQGYKHRKYSGGGERGRDSDPSKGRADDYYEHGARS